MTAATRHRLEGLEPDNLLAFMALLGLLRALEAARPDQDGRPGWRPRAYWDVEKHPLRPMLVLAEAQTPAAVAEASAEGAAELARAHAFDRDDLNHSRDEARALLKEALDYPSVGRASTTQRRRRRTLFDALLSDAAARDDERIWPTPLCFLFGQGHQHFLRRLADVPRGVLPKKLEKLKTPPDLNSPSTIARALFAPWTREDPTDGLRWDPAEDRRYALRADDPSSDPAGQQHGANRLAAVGLPVFSCAVVERRRETRLLSRAASYGEGGEIRFTWPIWTRPARLAGVAALLAHRELGRNEPDMTALAPLGVAHLMRAERIWVGKFCNVAASARIG